MERLSLWPSSPVSATLCKIPSNSRAAIGSAAVGIVTFRRRSNVVLIPHNSRSRISINSNNATDHGSTARSEEHTSELQSRLHLVCRLLLEKKKRIEIHVK